MDLKIGAKFGVKIGAFGMMMASVLALSACQSASHQAQPHLQKPSAQKLGAQKISRKASTQDLAPIRTELAARYIAAGQLDEAKRALDLALLADNRYAPAYDMMGVLLWREGSAQNLAAADGYFRRAIALDDGFVQAYNNYGVYLAQTGRASEAVPYLQTAGAHLGYAGRAQSLENLGFVLQELSQPAANDAFVRALQAGSQNPAVHLAVLDFYLQTQPTLAKALYDKMAQAGEQRLPADVLQRGVQLAALAGDDVAKQRRLALLQSAQSQNFTR
ncbi:hypothetical protein B0181_03640 [Moraxella caviae]|uniref:Predicted O-linked N-acetylglucosamine transferase, SPINDLY family n=1 Tax=Moraxella caviae TaxID=34060 RepID=A0A1T0A677_9GAMM|nr:hypothetical protein [Moraxella caviae]OOR91187.1 hypothetical protein B0181_03640 [Moraxella caviae]STZ13776.1 Predicted O-linked N-acetylglucosamine transferase, SPINDLY family [Moraxella caviae]VEW12655.1 Predicted O-linked N-acetylglucosamine transferase, SPINDLY family [Moraxella caviae]